MIGSLEVGLLLYWGIPLDWNAAALLTMMGLMAGFGLYFCVFAKEKLPGYYDENEYDTTTMNHFTKFRRPLYKTHLKEYDKIN